MNSCADRSQWQNFELLLSPGNRPLLAFFAIPLLLIVLPLLIGLMNGRLLGVSRRFGRGTDPFYYWSGQFGCLMALVPWGLLLFGFLSLPSCL